MELKLQIQLYSKMGTEFSGAPITFLGSIVLVTILIQQHPLFLIGKWRKKRSCKRLTTPFKMLSQDLRDNTRRTNNLRYKSNDKNTKSIFSNWKATCPPQRLILRLCPTTLLRGLEARWLRLHHPWCRAWKNGDNRGKLLFWIHPLDTMTRKLNFGYNFQQNLFWDDLLYWIFSVLPDFV